MVTEDEKTRIVEISNGLHHNQTLLAQHRDGDPEPTWHKPVLRRKEENETRLSN